MPRPMPRTGFVMGEWQVYPDQGILSGPSGEQRLEPKVMDVLVLLARRQGEVVRREELLDEVWAGTVVTDEALSRTISILRTQLGDNPREPTFIRTIPRIGYQLLMPVKTLPPALNSLVSAAPSTRRKWPVVFMFVALTAAIVKFMGASHDTESPGEPEGPMSFFDQLDLLLEQEEAGLETLSVAILPLDVFGDSDTIDAFGDGLTDELRAMLSRVPGLLVSPRRSALSFRNRADDLRNIARELNVDVVLDGTIRAEGDRYNVNLQIIDGAEGMIINAPSINVGSEDLYSALEGLVGDVVTELDVHFPEVALAVPVDIEREPDSEAYLLFLRNGNREWQLRGEAPLRRSIALYEQALALDPAFNRAWVALARSKVLLPWYSAAPVEATFEEVEAILDQRQFQDPRVLAEAESVRAFMAWNRWQWVAAEEHFQRALELAPDLANTFQWYSQHLSNVGRMADSLEAAKRARDLDELSPQFYDRLGTAYLWVDDLLSAGENFARSGMLGFNNTVNPSYAIFLIRARRFDQLKAVVDAWYDGAPQQDVWLKQHVDTLFMPEHRTEALDAARKLAKQVQDPIILPHLEFGLWGLLGGVDEVYATIERYRNTNHRYLPLEFLFTAEATAIREDARFDTLARDIGWTDYWEQYGKPDYQD